MIKADKHASLFFYTGYTGFRNICTWKEQQPIESCRGFSLLSVDRKLHRDGQYMCQGFQESSIPQVVVTLSFPLHQSCLKNIQGRKLLSISETNAFHQHVIIRPDDVCLRIRRGSMMHAGWRRTSESSVSYAEYFGFVLSDSSLHSREWLHIIGVIHYGNFLWGRSNSLRSSFSVALICSAAGATLRFLLLRSLGVQADTCAHFGCGRAPVYSTARQFRLYKPLRQKIRIVCYYNASPQWLERVLFWLWEQSTVAIKEPPSPRHTSPRTPFPSLFIYSKISIKMSASDPRSFLLLGQTEETPPALFGIQQRHLSYLFLVCWHTS